MCSESKNYCYLSAIIKAATEAKKESYNKKTMLKLSSLYVLLRLLVQHFSIIFVLLE